MLVTVGSSIIAFLLTLCPVLIAVAYVILAERKVMASVQRRRGPNVVGLYGLLQPFIDAVKLLIKEQIIPKQVHAGLFIIAPVLTLSIAVFLWAFIPFSESNYFFNFQHSALWVLAFSSISVVGLALAGWASNSSYANLGAIRAVSQFISYELVFVFALLPVFAIVGSLNLIDIVRWQEGTGMWFGIPLFPLFYIAFIATLAETNRTPFDLPEAEAELVAGYGVEYSSVFFILFMFAEYSNLLLFGSFLALIFLGGWSFPLPWISAFVAPEVVLGLKIALMAVVFIVVRATQPRLRFDQLMRACWVEILPICFGLSLYIVSLVLIRNQYVCEWCLGSC